MNELALFAGAGGGILGGHLLGWRTVCAVEWEAYPASVLCARQNDGLLPSFPIWDDVQTFDGKPWRGIVDVVSGGFPCQDISVAGGGTDLMENGQECGERWQGLLARLDQNTLLWKIPQCSLLEDLEQSLKTWPNWGSMRNGVCWEQTMLGQTIKENEFGLWPTPVTSDYAARRPSKGWRGTSDLPSVAWTRTGGKENPNKPPLKLNAPWVEWLMGWPLGWTDLKPLEMDKCHFVQQPHGNS